MKKHFFDIGANCGNTFDYFLLNRPEYYGSTVWCFEPSPQHHIFLLRKATDVSDKFNVVVCPFGVSGNMGVFTINQMSNNTQSDSFYTDIGGTIDTNIKYTVAAATVQISQLIRNFTSEGDEVTLKVDCEGCEYDIYEDLLKHPDLLKRIDIIYNEWHPGWADMDEVRRSRAEKILKEFSAYPIKFTDWSF